MQLLQPAESNIPVRNQSHIVLIAALICWMAISDDLRSDQAFFVDSFNESSVALNWDVDSDDSYVPCCPLRQTSSYYVVHALADCVKQSPAIRYTSLPGNRGPPAVS